MIQIDYVVAILTEAVLTFLELDTLGKALFTATQGRNFKAASELFSLICARKKDEIKRILTRLERHRSSLSLILNIGQW
jgi:hypothetical protein